MTDTIRDNVMELYNRLIRAIQANTSKDGSGTWYVPLLDSDGHLVTVMAAGTSAIGKVSGIPFSVAEEQAIDASLGAYAAGDVVGTDDCCTTLAVAWEWDVAQAAGGYVLITAVELINETENQAVQYDLLLFNATPTGDLRDNAANDNPVKADYQKWLGKISLPQSIAEGASVATYTSAYPGDGVSGLPRLVKCAAAATKLYGVLLTNTVYTHAAGDKIRILLSGEAYL